MRFTEIDIFGVYVAPISVLMAAAWIVMIVLRRIASRIGLLENVWHPSLLQFVAYIIILSSSVLLLARGALP